MQQILSLLTGLAISAGASLTAQTAAPAQPTELSQQDIEQRVKTEIARRAGASTETVRIVESSARTWPDAGLGCTARRGVLEPSPTPGFRIVGEVGGRRVVYHTDRYGRLLRCAAPGKPLGPISK